jgi:hypothetical protein
MVQTLATLLMIILSATVHADIVFPNLTADDLNGRSLNLPAFFRSYH